MNKRKVTYVLVIGIFLIAMFLTYNFSKARYIKININNNTDKEVSGLVIKSVVLDSDLKIPSILKESKYKTQILTSKNFSKGNEGNVVMYYLDKKGNKQEIYLLGYFEKGYNGTINVNINSIDSNGILKTSIKEH